MAAALSAREGGTACSRHAVKRPGGGALRHPGQVPAEREHAGQQSRPACGAEPLWAPAVGAVRAAPWFGMTQDERALGATAWAIAQVIGHLLLPSQCAPAIADLFDAGTYPASCCGSSAACHLGDSTATRQEGGEQVAPWPP